MANLGTYPIFASQPVLSSIRLFGVAPWAVSSIGCMRALRLGGEQPAPLSRNRQQA